LFRLFRLSKRNISLKVKKKITHIRLIIVILNKDTILVDRKQAK